MADWTGHALRVIHGASGTYPHSYVLADDSPSVREGMVAFKLGDRVTGEATAHPLGLFASAGSTRSVGVWRSAGTLVEIRPPLPRWLDLVGTIAATLPDGSIHLELAV